MASFGAWLQCIWSIPVGTIVRARVSQQALLTPPSQGMDGFVEDAFASALGRLSVARILFDVGDQARMENVLAIVSRINAVIKVEMGASKVQPNLCGHAFQCFQTILEQYLSVSLTA
jgi:hypothetical protein